MRKLTIRRSSATLPGVPGHEPGAVVTEQPPLAYRAALRALISCAASTVRLLWRGRIHLPSGHVGMRLRFADGTSARVYRETVADRGATRDPCVLVVEFRLRAVRGFGHNVFRWESLLNTPLFVGLVAGARPGVGAGLDSLPRAARAAACGPAGPAAGSGRPGGGRTGLGARGHGRMTARARSGIDGLLQHSGLAAIPIS